MFLEGTMDSIIIIIIIKSTVHCATSLKFVCQIPDNVIGNFFDIILQAALCPWG